MGDLIAGLVFCLIALVVLVLSITACLAVAVATALAYTALLPSEYINSMIARVSDEAPGPEEIGGTILASLFLVTSRPDWETAVSGYFFGAAEVDAKEIMSAAVERCTKRYKWAVSVAGVPNSEDALLFRLIIFIGMWLGLILGMMLGALFAAIVATIHIALMTTAALTMTGFCFALRGTDSAMRYVRGVVIRCPNSLCSRRVRPYPAYRCPGCRELHRDIRPGPLGVFRRACTCGERLPTLLLIGAGRFDAVCQQCGHELPAGIGTAAEIIAPVFGSVNAGKTQLVYMLTLALRQLAAERDITISIDSETDHRLKVIGDALTSSGNTAPTLAESPEPYILRLKVRLNERMIYLFDAAGEIHRRLVTLESLGYLDKGRTLIFVADPTSSDRLWNTLTDESQAKLESSRSNLDDIEIAYEQTREQMRRMGRRGKDIRFAFVLSKADLIKSEEVMQQHTRNALREIFVKSDYMDCGNLVREADQSFKSVDFFATSAVVDEDKRVDGSVVELARWILNAEGVLSV